ncbi:MAG: hypothetical protein LJE83_04835 [Gammaproteobacteria bacterium]|jgi:hypothetical protein|nr:hypothetical protein [Gammaproteobacteria bacterium]
MRWLVLMRLFNHPVKISFPQKNANKTLAGRDKALPFPAVDATNVCNVPYAGPQLQLNHYMQVRIHSGIDANAGMHRPNEFGPG